MNLLIKNARVVDPNSPFNSQSANIFIENGIMKKTGKNFLNKADKEISADGLCVSPAGKVVGIITKDQVHLNP